jgi:cytosine/adenosine deaminase-related metal-dependent hydrolase
MSITHVTSRSGTIYLHTHLAETGQEIAEALRPYIGRFAAFYPPNRYGHINPHKSTWGWIKAINGTMITVHVPRLGYTGDVDAWEAFGSYCTIIDYERDDPQS